MGKGNPDLMRSQGEEADLHSCPHCDRKFKRTVNFKTHLKTHEPKKFMCMWCKREFLQERTLLGHICSPVRKRFRCRICGENFHTRQKLQMHIRQKRMQGESCFPKQEEDESDQEVSLVALLDEKADPVSQVTTTLDEKSSHISQVALHDSEKKDCSDEVSIPENKPSESNKCDKDDCLIAIKRVDSRAVVVQNVASKSLLLTKQFIQQKKPDLPIGCSLAEFCGKRSILEHEIGSSPKFAKIKHKAEKSLDMQNSIKSMQTSKKDKYMRGSNRISVIRLQNGKEISRENLDDSELVSLRRERKVNGEDCVQVYRKQCNSDIGLIAQGETFHQGNKLGGNDCKEKVKANKSDLKKEYVHNQLTRTNVHLPEKTTCISKVGDLQKNRKMLYSGKVDDINNSGIKNTFACETSKNLSPVFLHNMNLPSLQSKNRFKCIPCKMTFRSLSSFHNHRIYHLNMVQQSSSVDNNTADVVSMQQQSDDVKITIIDKGKNIPLSWSKTQPTKLKVNVVTQAGRKSLACSKCGQKVKLQHEVQDYVGSLQEHSNAGEMVYISRFPRPSAGLSGKETFQCSCNQNLARVVGENKRSDSKNDDDVVYVKEEMTDDNIFREEPERPVVSSRKSKLQCSSFGNFDKNKRVLESNISSAVDVSGFFEARVKKEPSEDDISIKEDEVHVKKEQSEYDNLLRKEMESYELTGFDILDLRVRNPEAFANIKYELNEEDIDIVIKEEQDDTDSVC
ncbi:zinc finger protein Xfin-like [Penaeus chinensis]|uniref:zinc finger protein Xfin-like n=1 Tax=Penaeus chinensis TaxID=139456 RepID=UPI001FB7B285|nr:zinc finger protein Xfin-like [Penaeus chinensis]